MKKTSPRWLLMVSVLPILTCAIWISSKTAWAAIRVSIFVAGFSRERCGVALVPKGSKHAS